MMLDSRLVAVRGSFLLGVGLAACGDPVTDPNASTIASIGLSPTDPSVSVYDTIQLLAVPMNASGDAITTDRSVAWSITDTSVAENLGEGRFVGRQAGTAGIIATLDGTEATTPLTVTPRPIQSLRLSEAELRGFEGDTVFLTGEVRDDMHRLVADVTINWGSRDTTVAVVAGGVIELRRPGTTQILAVVPGTSGIALDSAVLTVHFRDLEPGTAKIRFRSGATGDRTWQWATDGVVIERMESNSGHQSTVIGDADASGFENVAGIPDSAFFIWMARYPSTGGRRELISWNPSQLGPEDPSTAGIPAASVLLRQPDGQLYGYLSREGSHLWVSQLSPPPGPGFITGEIHGTLTMRALGYVIGEDSNGWISAGPTGDSARVHIDFRAAYTHLQVGTADLQLVGGPHTGQVIDAETLAWPVGEPRDTIIEGNVVEWYRHYIQISGVVGEQAQPIDLLMLVPFVPLEGLQSGVLGSIDPGDVGDATAGWPEAWLYVDYVDSDAYGIARAGSVRARRWAPPSNPLLLGQGLNHFWDTVFVDLWSRSSNEPEGTTMLILRPGAEITQFDKWIYFNAPILPPGTTEERPFDIIHRLRALARMRR